MPEIGTQPDTPLSDIRVVELADEQAEYCGRVLSGLGADVIKVEPPQGNPTRRIGPFYQDREDPEGSLYFWHYNLGKKSAVIDIEAEPGKQRFLDLLATADVFLESTQRGYLEKLGLGPGDASTAVPQPDHRPRLPLRRRRAVGRLQGERSGSPGAGRPHDVHRLRPPAGRHV